MDGVGKSADDSGEVVAFGADTVIRLPRLDLDLALAAAAIAAVTPPNVLVPCDGSVAVDGIPPLLLLRRVAVVRERERAVADDLDLDLNFDFDDADADDDDGVGSLDGR